MVGLYFQRLFISRTFFHRTLLVPKFRTLFQKTFCSLQYSRRYFCSTIRGYICITLIGHVFSTLREYICSTLRGNIFSTLRRCICSTLGGFVCSTLRRYISSSLVEDLFAVHLKGIFAVHSEGILAVLICLQYT